MSFCVKKRAELQQPLDHKLIALSNGLVALVSNEDHTACSKYSWSTASGYPASRIRGKLVRMHRFLLGETPGMQVDHINRNRLDNRRCNLRLCTPQENGKNISSNRSVNGRGVQRKRTRWAAKITVARKQLHIGTFDSREEAMRAYDDAARQAFGIFAVTNYGN